MENRGRGEERGRVSEEDWGVADARVAFIENKALHFPREKPPLYTNPIDPYSNFEAPDSKACCWLKFGAFPSSFNCLIVPEAKAALGNGPKHRKSFYLGLSSRPLK